MGQRQFYLHTIFWGILMMLGIAGVISFFAFLLFEEPVEQYRSLTIAGILACGILFGVALWNVGTGEQRWKRKVIDKIINNPARILARWEYPFKQWQAFKQADIQRRRRDPIIATAFVVTMICVGAGIVYFTKGQQGVLIGISIPIVLMLGATVWWITQANILYLKRAYEQNKKGEILLSPEGAIINEEYIIPFDYLGGKLTEVKVSEQHKMPTLEFTIRMRTGTSNSYYQYHIPIPEGRDFEAGLVKQRYERQLQQAG